MKSKMFVNNGIHFITNRCAYDYIRSWEMSYIVYWFWYKILADIFQPSLGFLKFSDSMFLLCYILGVCKVFQQKKKKKTRFQLCIHFPILKLRVMNFLPMTYIFRICLHLFWFKHFLGRCILWPTSDVSLLFRFFN